jgi:type I restriction enzyme S subunit
MSTETKNKLVPRLRFPEFKNSGEWEVDIVGNVFDLIDGFSFLSSDFSDKKVNAKQVIRITEINSKNKNEDKVYISIDRIEELNIEKYKVTKGDLLLSLTGAAGFNFFIWNSEESYINQRTVKLLPKNEENNALTILLEPLIHKKINAIGTGQNNNLSKDALKDILFSFPKPKEQQKIASCLSYLDELIEAESQNLELYELHK